MAAPVWQNPAEQVLGHWPSRKGFYSIEEFGLSLGLVWMESDILFIKIRLSNIF